jgi:VWFA-related protein
MKTLVFILAILAVLPGAALAQQPAVFRAGTEQVIVPVTVKDSQGRLAEKLEAADFRLYEDRVEQKIASVTSDPASLAVVILIDSGVSRPTGDRVRATFPSLAEAIGELDEAAVVAFSTVARNVVSFTSNKQELHAGLHKITMGADYTLAGETMTSPVPRINGWPVGGAPSGPARASQGAPAPKNIDDAVMEAVRQLEPREAWRRKVILLITDGYNSPRNQVSETEVVAALRKSAIQVYPIGLDGAKISLGSSALPRYARASGGEMFPALRKTTLEPLYNQALEQARYQYVLTYTPRRPPTLAPGFRAIQVKVRQPGYTVIARDGYIPEIGPAQP